MALCESKIYTDSGDLNGGETIPELLDGKRSRKREGKTSPRLGKRRSSRIRKRGAGDEFGDVNSDSSDDSDPNIQLGDDVLIEEEEKIMIKEESNLDNQNAEKQLLAVALVRSVIDKHKADDNRQIMIKKEQPDENPVNISSDTQVKTDVTESASPTSGKNDDPNHNPRPKLEEKIEKDVVRETNMKENAANECNITQSQKQPHSSNINKTPAQRSTRSRSKVAKGGRTMALKGAYASIREAPRVVRRASTTIPVPNPILPSPAPNNANKMTTTSKVDHAVKMENMIQESQIPPITAQQAHPGQNLPTKLPSTNVSQNNVTTISKTTSNSAVMMSNRHPSSQPTTRRRIFSIDFDSEGFDFDITCSSPSADIVDSVSALPPIISSSSAIENKNSSLQTTSNQPSNFSVPPVESTMQPDTRDRGMSFELFSFAQNDSLPSSDPVDLNEEALNGGRPRGDSIIFDPVSFSDGNEEAAYQRLQQHSAAQSSDTNQIELTNASVFDNGSSQFQSNLQPQHIQNQTITPTNQQQGRSRSTHSRTNKSTRNSNADGNSYLRPSKSSAYTNSKSKTIHFTGNHFPHSEDTIHMPQGSAAAAAAAASLSSQVVPYSMNGTISHTACPMELLNKGGRIGIYLPEARRQRIAKFHSKRKNRIWRKRIKYDCRKKLADSRPRIKGRFVKSLEE